MSDPFEIPTHIALHYHLRQYQMSKFEAEYKMWLKLRNMEEYRIHDHFRLFVDTLGHKLWGECFE